jgi:hypothetical protein
MFRVTHMLAHMHTCTHVLWCLENMGSEKILRNGTLELVTPLWQCSFKLCFVCAEIPGWKPYYYCPPLLYLSDLALLPFFFF